MEAYKKCHVENNDLYNKYANVIDSIQNALMREFPQLIQEYRLNMKQAADLEDFINDRATMFRFLRKNSYSLPTTLSLLLDNIKWRLQQDVDNILIPNVEHFLQEPLVFFHEFDKSDRPILVINLAYLPLAPEGCDITEYLTPLVVFVLETARQLTWSLTKERELDEDVDDPLILETAVLVNFKNANSLPMDISLLKSFIGLLRRYPGLTGSVYFLNFGWMYQGLWQMCKLVLSDEARNRVSCPGQKELASIIAPEDLLADFGGDNDFSWTLENDDAFLNHRSSKAAILSRCSSVSSLHSTYYDTIDTTNSPYLSPTNGNNTAPNSPYHSPLSNYDTPVSLTPFSLTPGSSQTNLANVARAYSNLTLQSKLGPGLPPRLRSTFRSLGELLLTTTVTDEVSSRTLSEKLNELKQHRDTESTEPNYDNNGMALDANNMKNQLASSPSSSSLLSPGTPYSSKPSSIPPRAPQSWFIRLFWKFQDTINKITIRIATKILKYRGTLSWVLACILLRNGVQEVCQHVLLLMMELIVKGNTAAGSAIGLQSFLSLTAGQMTL